MLKNKIIAILCSLMLILPVFAEDVQNVAMTDSEKEVVETVYNTQGENIEEGSNLPENAVTTTPLNQDLSQQTYKSPISKRKIAKKFLLAMFGVLVSSVLIFGILSIYNKIRAKFTDGEPFVQQEENSLDSPEDLSEAVKCFLDKTKWE